MKTGDKVCGASCYAKGNTTTTMIRHLESHHKDEHMKVRNKMNPPTPTPKRKAEGKASNQNKVAKKDPSFFFGESDAALDKRVTDAVVAFLADTGTAIRVVGTSSFKNLMKVANRRIKLKSPKTYSRMVKVKAEEIHGEIRDIIKTIKEAGDIKSVAFTTDIWTSRSQDSFMSLTIHFIYQNWHLHSWTPSVKPFPESHTGINISMNLEAMVVDLYLNSGDIEIVHMREWQCKQHEIRY